MTGPTQMKYLNRIMNEVKREVQDQISKGPCLHGTPGQPILWIIKTKLPEFTACGFALAEWFLQARSRKRKKEIGKLFRKRSLMIICPVPRFPHRARFSSS